MAGADSVEKLEDVIVRSAEQVAGQIKAAKEAVSTVIFGQDRVIENTLVTILSGGHALLIGVPGLAKTKLVETLGVAIGIVDVDFHQEAIELRLGQRIGTLLLERILCREHVERLRQIMPRAGNGDVLLLHGLQQRRLGARAGAVDLVGHQELREHRA